MNLKLIPPEIRIYGDINYRDKNCPKEAIEQITFIGWVRRNYPDTHGKTIFHAKNEAKLIKGQFSAIDKDRAMGMVAGCSDIHDHGNPSLCMEIKRQDHTQSKISEEQIAYLLAAQQAGAFCCIALGWEAAKDAFLEWKCIDK